MTKRSCCTVVVAAAAAALLLKRKIVQVRQMGKLAAVGQEDPRWKRLTSFAHGWTQGNSRLGLDEQFLENLPF